MIERDIVEVLDNVIGVIEKENDFKERLKHLKYDCLYTAPEAMQEKWIEFGAIFCQYVPYPPTEDWHKAAVKHLTGEDYAVQSNGN